ncbi:MAG: M48 family metallopeptidase, partial [Candidatus Riflebacteria bacterium]
METKNLEGLHPIEYEHPFDQKALNALQNMPGLDVIIRKFNSTAVEPLIKIQYTGSHTQITKEFYPKIYNILDQACSILNLESRPLFYTQRDDEIDAFTIGVENPIIILNTGAIELCSEDELLFIMGHEIGHIKSRHTLYHQVGEFLPVMADFITGLGSLVTFPLQLALFRWARMSEFTADRAGLLACQNFASACRLMMKAAGVPSNYYDEMQIEAFIA